MKILVIGGNCQLGWELCGKGTSQGFDIGSLDIPGFDIPELETRVLKSLKRR